MIKVLQLLVLAGVLALPAAEAGRPEQAREALRKYASADKLVIFRGAVCHPWRVRPRLIAEVRGTGEVQEVIAHLIVSEPKVVWETDPETGARYRIGGPIMLMMCPDYTLFFSRAGKLLGFVGIIGNSMIRLGGEVGDAGLTEAAAMYLHDRFGLLDEPGVAEPSLPFTLPRPPSPYRPELPVHLERPPIRIEMPPLDLLPKSS
ncbi:MAG TPA: hypothetical protein PLU52_06880 [Opitutaceae bacterium]|nr:hypothetical protein [Opitutaceae bacterium]HND61244.1 hypothetical protein [Opitutaceae bacterium]